MVTRTFKKVLNIIAVGTTVQTNTDVVQGADAVTLGQTSITDAVVPAGSKVTAIKVCYSASNLATIGSELAVALHYRLSGQSSVDPMAVGTNQQRAQVIKTWHKGLAQDESLNINEWVKIPRPFQRVKDGMKWTISANGNAVARTESMMFVYKVKQ